MANGVKRRARDPQATRADILEAALSLLAKDGPEAISLSAVAVLAGVNRGTAYQHFETRERLIEETIAYVSDKLYRAVLEGIAYALHHNIETGTLDGHPLDEAITIVGGASQSDLWMQIIADVTGRPVFTIAEEVEASLGAAQLAAYGVGLIDAATVRKGWVQLVPRAQPQEPARSTYAALFKLYVALYPKLKSVMHQLRQISVATAPAGTLLP